MTAPHTLIGKTSSLPAQPADSTDYPEPATIPARRTRVLHIVPDLGVGGLPRVVETLCRATDPSRFEVSVLCLEYIGALGEGLRQQGIRVDLVPWPTHPDRLAPLKIAGYLIRNRFDVVHTHNTQAFIEGLPAALVALVPIRIHTDHARLYPDRRRYILAERILSRLATRVVAVSEHTASDLQRHQRIPARLITTIPNGVDGSQFGRGIDVAAKRRELGLPPDGPVLGLASRIVEQKGIIYLLQALVPLIQRFPSLHVLIAGEGDLEDSLKTAARELGVADHAHFLGLRRDTAELFKAMDVFMLPSVWEGLPMALLEAMAAGLPVIATQVGGVAAAVHAQSNGFLIPPADSSAIVAAVDALLSDPQKLRAYGAASRQIFEERFSATAMARAYAELYTGRRVP